MEELEFPLERSPSLRLLGIIWTGSFSGQVLVGVLLLIGIYFIGSEGFNILSITFFIGFILPMAFMLHRRLVRKGKKLMKPWCKIRLEDKVLSYKTGFPNTMNPDWQTVKITKEIKDIIIIGSEIGGYHIKLSGKANPPIRLGLWSNINGARESSKDLSELLGGKVKEELINSEAVSDKS